MRIYPQSRWYATLLLVSYLGIRLELAPSWWSELVLYNLVVLAVIIQIAIAPDFGDKRGKSAVILALASWGIGSVSSSIDSFLGTELSLLSEIAYLIFYPIILFGMVRSLRAEDRSQSLQLLDTLLIAFSGTTLIASLFLEPASRRIGGSDFQVFLSILYPIADLVLLFTMISIVVMQGMNGRNLYFLAAITIFSVTDFYYLWKSQEGSYIFGSLSDTGWLVAFIFLSQSFWYRADEGIKPRNLNPSFVSIALGLSTLVLAISALRPDYFPRFVLVPAFVTLGLAFLRMSVAMNDARKVSDERILARTDELTGLANRRRFLAELEDFQKRPGSLLIMDLDGFKPVNDRLGHEVGDLLLAQVARRFQRVVARDSILARLGGDEFGVLIPGLDGTEVALALRATLSYPFKVGGAEIRLDVSIGEAFNPADGSVSDLLRRADEAMYQAKRARSGVARWTPSIMS